jgi:transposase
VLLRPKALRRSKKLAVAFDAPETELPELVRQLGHDYIDMIKALTARIAVLDRALQQVTAADEKTAFMRTVPSVGPITAAAIEAIAPSLARFRRGCDFAAWLGLVPKQHSTGGKETLGRVSKMGQRKRPFRCPRTCPRAGDDGQSNSIVTPIWFRPSRGGTTLE